MRVASALTAVIIVTALAAGVWSGVRYYQSTQTPQFQMTGKGVESLPEFALPDLEGKLRNSSEW
jgi:predicted negative regulator of RcsB-dependent stress response